MGSDNPRPSVSGVNRFSGGASGLTAGATIRDVTVEQPKSLFADVAASVAQAGAVIADNMEKQRKQQEESDRAVAFAKLNSDTSLGAIEKLNQQEQSYAGMTDDYTKTYMASLDESTAKIAAGITDKKLKAQYNEFVPALRAKMYVQSLQNQQGRYVSVFKSNFRAASDSNTALLNASPTKDTFKYALKNLDDIYTPMIETLQGAGAHDAAEQELATTKAAYAEQLISRTLQSDPTGQAAQNLLEDPEINQYLTGSNDYIRLQNHITSSKEAQLAPLRAEAKDISSNIVAGLATGKDVAGLRTKLGQLNQFGVVDPDDIRKIEVAQQMSGQFATLRSHMFGMSDAQFDDELAAMNPSLISGPADDSLNDRIAFYNAAVPALRDLKRISEDNPVDAAAAVTGATDPEVARMQAIHMKLANGANLQDIKILNKVPAEQMLGRFNNLASTGDVDGAISFFNEIREQYGSGEGHPERQVASGVDQADLVLNQMAAMSKHPLGRALIAAYHLIPKDAPLNDHNSLLIRAAMMTGDERNTLLKQSGLADTQEPGNALDELDLRLMKTNKLWKTYFSPPSPSPNGARLLQDQRNLLKDTFLLTIASNSYKSSGGVGVEGFFKVGETSALDNAVNAVVTDFVPYEVLNVQGNPARMDPGTPNAYGVIPKLPNRFRITGPLGDLVNPFDGRPVEIARKDWRVNIKSSDVVIPKELKGQITGDSLNQYVSNHMLNDDYLFHNAVLPGINDHITSPTASNKWGQPEPFVASATAIARRVGANPDDLMAVMKIESGFRPNAVNPKSGATGLIQWMNAPNGDKEALKNLGAEQQLGYVGQWFAPHRGKLTSPGRVYLAVAAPGVLSRLPANAGPETIVYKAGSREAKANPGWHDANGNVTLGSLDALVVKTKQRAGITGGPQGVAHLPEGQKMLYTQKMNQVRQTLSIKNNEALDGVRVYTVQNGREIPIKSPKGGFLEFKFSDMQNFKLSQR